MGATNGWGQDPGSRQDLGDQLMRLIRLVERAAMQFKGRDEGVDRASYLLLVHLVRQGPRRLTALAEAVHSDPSTVSRQVAALVRGGLVERLADPGDGRASLLAATPQGERVHADARRRRDAFVADVVDGWSADDRATFLALLGRFNDGVTRLRPRAETPTVDTRAADTPAADTSAPHPGVAR